MEIEINFDPAETFDEVSSNLDSLELCGGWKVFSFKSGEIMKFRKDTDDNLIFASEALINRSPDEIAEVILETELRKKWDKYLKNSESLHRWGKNLQLIYMQQTYAWPLSDRDFVLVQGVSRYENERVTIGWKSVEYDKKPPLSRFVRGTIHFSGYVITKISDETSHVSFIDKSNPNGLIPEVMWRSLEKKTVETLISLKKFIMS